MGKTAIILARVSTAGQAEKELPIESQIEVSRSRAALLGAEVLKVFIEDGVSGRKVNRDVFDDAVEYCKAHQVDYFILWNTARFARHRALAAWTKYNIRRFGTEMVYVSQNIDASTDEGWLMEGLFELMDENTSRTISKDTRRSMMKNARDGFFNGGNVPYGFTVKAEGQRRRLTPHPVEAPVVRSVFDEFLKGVGTKSIARLMNDMGRLRRGRRWDKDHVGYMLKNWVYAGYITYNRHDPATRTIRPEDEWIRVKGHEPIITEEKFAMVQQQFIERTPIQSAAKPQKGKFLFSGMLRCGACNQTMQIETASGRSRSYSYYNCRSALRGSGCSNRRMSAPDVDQWLLSSVLDRILTADRIKEIALQIHAMKGAWVQDRELSRKVMVADLRKAEARRRRLFEVLELHGVNAPNLGDLKPRLEELNATIRGIEGRLTDLEQMEVPQVELDARQLDELSEYFRAIVENSDNPGKVRDFLSSFIDSVVITDGEAMINYNPSKLVGGGDQSNGDGDGGGGGAGPGGGGGAVHRSATRHPIYPPYYEPAVLVVELPIRFRRAA